MNDKPNIGFTPFLLIFLIVGLCYSNTLNASWQFDDYQNIVNNSRIHLNHISLNSLIDTFFSGSDNRFYRPLPCLTFALNWYFGKDNVFGYHIINIGIHLINAFMLFLTLTLLSSAPKSSPISNRKAYSVCLLAVVLWAVHPIQVQAITYIVQRMALLAAMFYIIGIFFYVKARLSIAPLTRIFSYSCCFIAYLLAILSKENSAVMPLAILLVEIIFFSDNQFAYLRKIVTFRTTILLISGLSIIFTLYFLMSENFDFLHEGYDIRSFTMAERLLTEPRIILKYLLQIFYPLDSAFSLEHDIQISTSLLHPWVTLPAILINVAIITFGFIQYKKMPLLSFAILFFYVNHIVESTFIPLELIFEHRNYLPTMFLFVPISYGVISILNYLKKSNRFIYQVTFVSITFILFTLCLGTYTRNRVWATEKGLWEDVLLKYSYLSRPYQKMAEIYKGEGYDDLAFTLYEKALPLYHPVPKESRFVCLNNMGNIYVAKGKYWKAIDLYRKALPLNSQNRMDIKYFDYNVSSILYNMAFAYLKAGEWKEAEKLCDQLLRLDSQNSKYLEFKGFLLIEHGKPDEAIPYLERAMSLSPKNINVLLYDGFALMQTGEFKRSLSILQEAHTLYPNDMVILFCILENCFESNDHTLAEKYMETMMNQFTLPELKKTADDFKKGSDPTRLSLPIDRVSDAIADYLTSESKIIAGCHSSK